MDDISRESAPGPGLRRPKRGKGPAEVLDLEGLAVDEDIPGPADEESGGARASVVVDKSRAGAGRGAKPTARKAVRRAQAAIDESEPSVELADSPAVADVMEASDGAPADRDADPLDDLPEEAELPELKNPEELAKILFAIMLSSREAQSVMRLAEVCNSTQKAIKAGLTHLGSWLRDQGFPLELHQAGEKYRLLTLPAVYPYLQRMKSLKKADKLSPAALETLAVVAYRQPVIRAEVESIRGVKAGPTLRSLLDHKLIKVVGRADVPGRPLQYGTTDHFLERFGLSSLKDLPSIQEFRSLG